MKKPTEKQKAEIRGYIKKWRARLYLHQWEFLTCYLDDEEQGVDIKMQTEYKNATLSIHGRFFELEKQKREAVIVHELCHCIVQPLIEIACRAAEGCGLSQREIDWHKENVTQHIATVIYF